MARKYQHMQHLMPQIVEMLEQGMTQKEVEQALGLTGYRPVHALLKRERKKERSIPKQRRRIRKIMTIDQLLELLAINAEVSAMFS